MTERLGIAHVQVSQVVKKRVASLVNKPRIDFWPKKKKKNRLPMQEMQFQSLGWEDPLEKEMATHSSFLASESPCTEEPGGLQSMGSQSVRHN